MQAFILTSHDAVDRVRGFKAGHHWMMGFRIVPTDVPVSR